MAVAIAQERRFLMPLLVQGRLLSVNVEDATPATKDRDAKPECLKLDVYDPTAKKKNKCLEVKAPIELKADLELEVGDMVSFPVNIYPYGTGNGGADFSLSLIHSEK